MKDEKLLEIFMEVLDNYVSSEENCISDFGGSYEELETEKQEYIKKFNDVLASQ